MKYPNPWLRVSKLTLTGVATVVPLVGTIWLIFMIIRMLIRAGMRMLNFVWGGMTGRESESLDFAGVEVLHFLLPLALFFGVGLFVVSPPGRHALRVIESVVSRLPLIGFIYNALRQFVTALQELGAERQFKSVVYVEYPSPGCKLLAFVTGNFFDKQQGKDVTSVFIPTSPNPLTGFMVLIEDEKVIPCDMTVEQATKMVLSAGLVTPGEKKKRASE
ncbi:DUF502 domain-containing protein [Rubritalea spongiae]|uniref:DUF502 domain-containing protein n=1 Tax=Rubritalea spongiae TaxID=430797 RepID=A0ABW5E4D3_9BACT